MGIPVIAILVFISAGAGIMGTFLIKPVVNNLRAGQYEGAYHCCAEWVSCMRAWCVSTLGYNRFMAYFPEGGK